MASQHALRTAACSGRRGLGVPGRLKRSVAVQAAAGVGAQAPLQPDSGGDGGGGSGGGSGGGGPAVPPEGVEVVYRGRRLQAERGATLRTAMLQAGVTPHNGRASLINCRGLGTCGTCAVEVRGEVEPREWTTQESLRLNFPPHGPPNNQRLRLACQVACLADRLHVVKRKGFWGHRERVLPDMPDAASAGGGAAGAQAGGTVAPLGRLEFVLDRRQRRQGSQGGGS